MKFLARSSDLQLDQIALFVYSMSWCPSQYQDRLFLCPIDCVCDILSLWTKIRTLGSNLVAILQMFSANLRRKRSVIRLPPVSLFSPGKRGTEAFRSLAYLTRWESYNSIDSSHISFFEAARGPQNK